jgi:hypothetical protein
VLTDEKELRVYEPNRNQKFAYSFRRPVRLPPRVFAPLPETAFLTAYVEDEQRAYLFNTVGNIVTGFPIEAVAPLLVDNLRDSKTSYSVLACDKNGYLSCYNIQP